MMGENRFKAKTTTAQYAKKTKKASKCVIETENKDAYFKLDKNSPTEKR